MNRIILSVLIFVFSVEIAAAGKMNTVFAERGDQTITLSGVLLDTAAQLVLKCEVGDNTVDFNFVVPRKEFSNSGIKITRNNILSDTESIVPVEIKMTIMPTPEEKFVIEKKLMAAYDHESDYIYVIMQSNPTFPNYVEQSKLNEVADTFTNMTFKIDVSVSGADVGHIWAYTGVMFHSGKDSDKLTAVKEKCISADR